MRRLASIAGAIGKVIGPREIGLLAGLVLVGYGAWSVYPPAGFVAPGAVLLYVVIAGLR